MKKSFYLKNCHTLEDVENAAAELLIWNCEHEFGKRRSSERYSDREWAGFCSALHSLFDDDDSPQKRSEWYEKTSALLAKVKEVGVDNYPWCWEKKAPFSDAVMSLVGMKLMGREILSVSEDPERSGVVLFDLGDSEFPLRLHISDAEKLAKDGTLVLSQWCGGGHKLCYCLQHADGSNAFEEYPVL